MTRLTLPPTDVRPTDLVRITDEKFAPIRSIAVVSAAGGVLIETDTSPVRVTVFREFGATVEVLR